jgi:transcriptional antiterminator RfaH
LEKKEMNKSWYALYTRSRAEKKVLQEFRDTGIECYLPLRKTIKQWSDRKKKVEEPVIRSYIFVRIRPVDKNNVFVSPHIVRYVTHEGKPAVIPDRQMEALKSVVESGVDYEVNTSHLKKGDKVKVTTGALKDVDGEILEIGKNKKLVIRIDHVGYSLTMNIPANFVKL